MSEANKILVRRLIDEIWNQCSTTAMDELIDNDIIRRDPAPFGELNGREAYKQLVLADFAAFPDLRVTLVDMIAEGDCVAGAWTAQGTHTGTMTLPGVQFAPTGKTASFDGTSRLRLRAGRFVEDLVAWSPLSMFQQLGLAADPVAAGANRLMMVRVMEELFNQGKLAVADECCTRDYVHHGPQGVDSRGPQGLKDSVLSMRTVFPDLRFIVDEQTTTDDRVALRWTVSGTHSAEWMGVPATGRRITLRGVSTSSVAGGKLSETWANWDVLDALQQLGAAPAMAKGAAAAG